MPQGLEKTGSRGLVDASNVVERKIDLLDIPGSSR